MIFPSVKTKRGFYFAIDGLLAMAIIVTALLLFLSQPKSQYSENQLQTTARDAVNMLNTLTVGELSTPSTAAVLATNLTNGNDTVLRAIGVMWATNNSLAPTYTQEVLDLFVPKYSYAVYVEGDEIMNKTLSPESKAYIVSSAKQQVSGIAQGRPVSGSTATAFLKKVENRSTASYVTFGGFVGQGNLSFLLTDIPSDISNQTIRDMTIELDTPLPFSVLINDAACGYYIPSGLQNGSADSFTLNCPLLLHAGTNTVDIQFNGSLDQSYISGGLLRVRYSTNDAPIDPYASPQIVHLPGIEGIINLYDSFFVPGNVTSMKINLHYLANHTGGLANNTFYITIGNTTVYHDNTSILPQDVVLTDANLTPLLNYSQLGGQTIPIRIGFQNLSFSTVYTGNANVMLATDTSGSMDWNFISDNTPGAPLRECNDPLLNDSTTQRLSVAKCLDKEFSGDILNLTGNLIGLVSYSSSTNAAQTVPLSSNGVTINSTIGNTTTGYSAGGNTCICCGINSAVAQLSAGITKTTFIAKGSSWSYFFANGSVTPLANDSMNHAWYDPAYTDAANWSEGPAVLGSAENGTGPAIVTDMNNSILRLIQVPNMWEKAADTASPEVDFTSGLNSTGNTFGVAGAQDGWDWQGGTYGYSGTVDFPGVVNQALRINLNTTPGNRNNCANNDCSGAYGISINITPALWSTIKQSGNARLGFKYSWNSNPTNPFESSDEVWIKARWTNSSGFVTNLGSEQSNQGGDSTPEIDFRSNPNVDFSGTFTTDITSLIQGPGIYYLDFGGKLEANAADEWGWFTFDDVLVAVTNQTDVYYLRSNFNVTNLSKIQTGILNVLSDDRATVYVNGVLVTDELLAHSAQYWNIHGITLPQSMFVQGQNTVAVKLENNIGTAKFDAQLQGLNQSKNLAMLLMTDGQSNIQCAAQGTGDALTDAIQAACDAKEDWGITVHTVGFSSSADNATLQAAADCAGGLSTSSANTSELSEFYRNVVINILDSSVKSQSIILSGAYQASSLFNDSSLEFTYQPAYTPLSLNEISVRTQTPPFSSCSPNVFISPNARVLTGQVTSYSGDHWTDLVKANGITAYNLSSYQTPYLALGDPFVVDIPPSLFQPGANTLNINTGDSPLNSTGCSQNDSLITTLAVSLSTAYTPVVEDAVGCTWTVERDDGTKQTVPVPNNYAGNNTCSYTNASINYNAVDAYDVATYSLLRSLDYDGDGRIFISFSDADLEIIVSKISQVPYLWGPSLVEVRVWQ